VSKRTDPKEGTQFRIIMEHKKIYIYFSFGLSLTRKSFWRLELNDPVIDVGT
jgi:hypothetical protein